MILDIVMITAAYLIGSIPFGYLAARLRGIDIRQHGSGNIGATNVTRVLGRPWGIACFILDFAKGLVPVVTVLLVVGPGPTSAIAAAAAVAGHVWPVYLRFRGGKGVATSIGALLAVAPFCVLLAVGFWALLFLLTRYVSVASLGAAVMLPISAIILRLTTTRITTSTIILLTMVAILIIVRHRSNIKRLARGEELRFSRKRKQAQ